MAFNITKHVSRLLESKRACCMSDLPAFIARYGKPVIDDSDNFTTTSYEVYALIKHDQNFHNWRLSLRAYDFNPITYDFIPLYDVLPESWQNARRKMELTRMIITLLSEDNLIFLGRPSLRNTSIISYHHDFSQVSLRHLGEILSADDCRIFVTC